MLLSVVLPAFNEEAVVPIACRRVAGVLETAGLDYELVVVDDGSTDGTWQSIGSASAENPRVRGVGFSRNFGKDAAILSGLEAARGDCRVVMDCDMQHPPEAIPRMVDLWREGYEVVEGKKAHRGKESGVYRGFSKLFYTLISALTGAKLADTSDFKLLDRAACEALLKIPEKDMFFRAMSSWIGFRSASVEFEVEERAAGSGKWKAKALFKYAMRNITSFSSAPMQIVTLLGFLTLLVAVGLGIQTLVRYLTGTAMSGFTTVILLILFFFSLVMISLGIIGYYIARIFDALKDRPRYIVMRRIDPEDK